jgi:hypothetical protein
MNQYTHIWLVVMSDNYVMQSFNGVNASRTAAWWFHMLLPKWQAFSGWG